LKIKFIKDAKLGQPVTHEILAIKTTMIKWTKSSTALHFSGSRSHFTWICHKREQKTKFI